MSALKTRIVDMIEQGGEEGVPVEAVFDAIFRRRGWSRPTLQAHVWQINQLLASQGYRIASFHQEDQRRCFRMTRFMAGARA